MIPGDQPLSVMPNGPGDLNCWPLGPKQKVKFSKHGVALTPRMDAKSHGLHKVIRFGMWIGVCH